MHLHPGDIRERGLIARTLFATDGPQYSGAVRTYLTRLVAGMQAASYSTDASDVRRVCAAGASSGVSFAMHGVIRVLVHDYKVAIADLAPLAAERPLVAYWIEEMRAGRNPFMKLDASGGDPMLWVQKGESPVPIPIRSRYSPVPHCMRS